MSDILDKVDKLILRNKKLENDKSNLYSEYLIDLYKDFSFDTKFSSNKKINKIMQSDLISEASSILYDLRRYFDKDDEDEYDLFLILKARFFTEFFIVYFTRIIGLEENLTYKCKNYLKDFDNFANNCIFVDSTKGIIGQPIEDEYDLSGKKLQKL